MSAMNPMWEASSLQSIQANSHARFHPNFVNWQQQQLEAFLRLGFPTSRYEEWKYTDVSPIAKQAFTPHSQTSIDKIDVDSLRVKGAYQIVFINGQYASNVSRIENLPSGVSVRPLQTMLSEQHAANFNIPTAFQTPFSLLNGALLSNGLFLSVDAGTHLHSPIQIMYINTESPFLLTCPRNIFIVGDNSSVEIFESYYGNTMAAYFNNVVTQIEVGKNASLKLSKLQNESDAGFHIANTIIRQHKDSRVYTVCVSMGAKLSRDDLTVMLLEEGADCKLLGLYCLDGDRHIDHHTRIDHQVPYCTSQQNYKAIVDGRSRAVFNGKIVVQPGAVKTQAHQSNKNLLLSKTAEINTKPELEIYTDDVQCAHGATVGQLDEEALFYLRSRGISREMAQHLLTCAFANEVLDQIQHPDIASILRQRVIHRLQTKHCLGDCHDK